LLPCWHCRGVVGEIMSDSVVGRFSVNEGGNGTCEHKENPGLQAFRPQSRGVFSGAGNGIRTRDPNLGKVVLYQLSYSRIGGAR
jgi:hypothetical protein